LAKTSHHLAGLVVTVTATSVTVITNTTVMVRAVGLWVSLNYTIHSTLHHLLGPDWDDLTGAMLCFCCLQLRLLFRLREVAEGMLHLHQRAAVVHGDLKSANVLLTVDPVAPYGRTAKITDFGLSRALACGQTHRSTHTLGTVSCTA
jgi:hypothetical protein